MRLNIVLDCIPPHSTAHHEIECIGLHSTARHVMVLLTWSQWRAIYERGGIAAVREQARLNLEMVSFNLYLRVQSFPQFVSPQQL